MQFVHSLSRILTFLLETITTSCILSPVISLLLNSLCSDKRTLCKPFVVDYTCRYFTCNIDNNTMVVWSTTCTLLNLFQSRNAISAVHYWSQWTIKLLTAFVVFYAVRIIVIHVCVMHCLSFIDLHSTVSRSTAVLYIYCCCICCHSKQLLLISASIVTSYINWSKYSIAKVIIWTKEHTKLPQHWYTLHRMHFTQSYVNPILNVDEQIWWTQFVCYSIFPKSSR